MFENFIYKKMEVCLRALEPANLPAYKGSMLRGVIGQTLRRVSCISKDTECTKCSHSNVCPYANVFYCVDKNDDDMLTTVDTLPNPFIIYPLDNGMMKCKQGDLLKFNLTLLGKAVLNIHYFIHAIYEIRNLGLGFERKKFEAVHINDADTGGIIADEGTIYYENIKGNTIKTYNSELDHITFVFDTPLRIKDDGRFTENISFHVLLKNILRRIAMVSEYHIGERFSINHKELLEKSRDIKTCSINLRWQPMDRYSSRVKRKLSMGGVLGEISFKGDLSQYYPFLYAGKLFHIGKGCTIGLGHYNLLIKNQKTERGD